MKKILIAFFVLMSFVAHGQTKDSVIYKHDTVAVISVADCITVLKFLEDKYTKTQYDKAVETFNYVMQLVDQKRKMIIKVKSK